MKTLRSYVCGRWHAAEAGFTPLHNPATEAEIARASSDGIDFGATLDHARTAGGGALREMTFAERGAMLKAVSKALYERRDELLEISVENAGTTRRDAKFDVDGATGTLAYYAALGRDLGDARFRVDGEGVALGRTPRFWGEHVLVPRHGAAVLINAFNFPAWGWAEKAAAAWLAGMPVIIKPATSTAMLAERCIEIVVEAGVVPDGAVSLISGSAGDLLSRLGGQDVLAFTGSADTAQKLRGLPNLLADSTAVNIEADSLNAAVLGVDVEPGSETWDLFVRDVAREITQKSGQKCTAVRRVFVPASRIDEVQDALVEQFEGVVVGDPADDAVSMGPLATAQQLADAVERVAQLAAVAGVVHGDGTRVDGKGAEAGRGWFFGPTLLRARGVDGIDPVHHVEAFAPVATLVPYDGATASAAREVARGGGTLVTSLYADDDDQVAAFLGAAGAFTGRLYLGSEKMAAQAPGSGVALPQSLHGGPGRAGGGEELGGLRSLGLYSQRVALQGSRPMVQRVAGSSGGGGAS